MNAMSARPSVPDASRSRAIRLIRSACPSLLLAIAVANLAWWWAVATQRTAVDFLVPAAPSTSVCFLFLASALGLRIWLPNRNWARSVSWSLVGLVAIAASHVMLAAYKGEHPFWEHWFGPVDLIVKGFPIAHMVAYTAALLLVSSFGFATLFAQRLARSWLVNLGIVATSLGTVIAIGLTISYASGDQMVSGGGSAIFSPSTAIEFLLFNTGLLVSSECIRWLRRWLFGATGETDRLSRDERLVLISVVVTGLIMIVGGMTLLHLQARRQREKVLSELLALTNLKVEQITAWRRERLGDARTIAGVPGLPDVMHAVIAGSATKATRVELADWFERLELDYGYATVMLLDGALNPVLSEPGGAVVPAGACRFPLSYFRGNPDVVELPPYVDRAGELHWDLLLPLQSHSDSDPFGAVLLQTTPERLLLPLVRSLPTTITTGQSVLWFRDDDRLISLGGYRAQPYTDATELQPFGIVRLLSDQNPQSLLFRAVNGQPAEGEGVDHQGVAVIGVARSVPDSSWFLVSQIDAQEVYAPLRRAAVAGAGGVMGLLLLTGIVAGGLWRQRQKNLLAAHLAAELEQKRTAARLGMVMQEARDVILVLDESLRIIEANEQAPVVYGWSREELLGMPVRDLRATESTGDFTHVSQSVTAGTGATFETEHRRKDGSTFPVEVSARLVEGDGRKQILSIIRDITERRRAEAELRASEERYRLIAENTSDVIWLYDFALDGFTYVSASSSSLLGYAPDELVGTKLTSTLTNESAAKAGELLHDLLAEIRPGAAAHHTVVELDQRRKDGSIVPTEVVASVMPDPAGGARHILGITRDITERRRAREALEKFNTQLEQRVEQRTSEIQALLDAIPDTVLLCDEQGAVVFAHSISYPGIAGLVKGEAAAARRPELDAAIREIVRDMHALAPRGSQTVVKEYERPLEAGKTAWLEARAAPMPQGRVLVFLREISERKRHELGVLANLAREQQLSEMKSQFISVASHEFRTPLAAAVGTLELIERHAAKLTEAKRTELISRIQRSLSRLTEIMDDVLQLSRADSGRVKATRINADLVRLAQDIVREVESGDGQKHRFVFESDAGTGTVPVDTKLTNHILSNLVGNAVRYSPAGTTVTVKLRIDEAAFTFLVIDEGIGIPEAEREHIFEPFARGSNVGQISGTGLGLNIVKRYTELMGGTIELLPAERGTTFSVRIPLTQPTA
jgi:PAS domain S-box-containing protein